MMTVEQARDRADELEEVLVQMKELLEQAYQLVRGTPEEDRAKAYWLAHITMALDNDHSYLGRGSVTMLDTVNALRCEDDEEEAA